MDDKKKKSIADEEVNEKGKDINNLEEEIKESADKEKNEDIEKNEVEATILEFKEKIDVLEKGKEDYYNKLLRLQADFINFRKRAEKDKERIGFTVKSAIFTELLPIVDNFERALNSEADNGDFKKGIDLIYRQLVKFMNDQGIEVINSVGESFDHNYHNAVMQVADTDYESGIIIEELQKGYILDNKVIRPAMVKVAN